MLAKALNERINELYDDEEDKAESSSSSPQSPGQESVTSKDPYNNELFQDGQDQFA